MRRVLIFASLLACALAPAAARAAAVPAGATWTQEYVPTPDGQELHAEVLRPKGVNGRTPVIAIVSPYLGHAAEAGADGRPAPSERFSDFFKGARVFERGYAVVMVDLRGTGGSSGCLDILGPGEQTDIKTAIEWAASRPWSTGKVGMYGKSYDGNTGVVGAALRPKGLKAVVGQEVVGDRYRGSYSDGVRYLQSVAYPFASYGSQGEAGFTTNDDSRYTLNSASHSVDCQAGLAGHYDPDPSTEFWRARDFIAKGKGSKVPFLMTTGFLDTNTNIGAGAIDFYNVLAGPKRLWLGWWDHVRGNDTVANRPAMGRAGWFDEVIRFYDRHLKGVTPAKADPAVAVEGSDGRWRSETAWPPADAAPLRAPLKSGSYADDGRNLGSGDSAAGAGGAQAVDGSPYGFGSGTWTASPPLPYAAHLAGIPTARVDVTPLLPKTNLVVNVYDVAPDGTTTMVSRGARLCDAAGPAAVTLYPTDWAFAPGHRIGVLVSGSNAEAWVHVPTNTTVAVGGGTVTLPFLRYTRSANLAGTRSPRLESYLRTAPFTVSAEMMKSATQPALVPPRQVAGRG